MQLKTMLAGLELEHPLMNAAGTCKTLEDVKRLSRSATAAIMVGSITKELRDGNSGNVYWAETMFSLNSLGLPNLGADYYLDTLPEMVRIAHGEGKPLFVSVAGFAPHEYGYLTKLAIECGADMVELNLSCPNVWKGGIQEGIACFDKDLVHEILLSVTKAVGTDERVSAKISPFTDPSALWRLSSEMMKFPLIKAVTTSNTFPSAFAYNGKKPRITHGSGLAGLAGPSLKPIALGQVRQLNVYLGKNIQIIGVGGITRGGDVLEYLQSGAVITQVATAYLEQKERVFSSLIEELVEPAEV